MNSGKICISVSAGTADETIEKIGRASVLADVIEVRFDRVANDEIPALLAAISNAPPAKPLIATLRPRGEGGGRDLTIAERREFWRHNTGLFWGGDFEEDIFAEFDGSLNSIISHHDLAGVPGDLDAIYERFAATDADIIKIAISARDAADAVPVWKLIDRAGSDGKQVVPIAMGEAGKWSRLLGLANGAALTYASLETGDETADGQLTAEDLINVYRVRDLDRETKVFGVLGDPVSRSISPFMHNPAFVSAGLNAVFIPFLVKNFDEFVRRMVKPVSREIDLNFAGFSVTMPHKQSIMPHLDTIDPVAKAIGAVNTVKVTDGKLTGYNTDAHGFMTPLIARFGDVKSARVAVFGAGGAARAVVFALKQVGAEVSVFARNAAKAHSFGAEFDVDVHPFGGASGFDIVVNATPLGMKGVGESETILTANDLNGCSLVYDLVTSMSDTPLIAEAKKAHVPHLNGIEMLLAQGALQFEIWTGMTAPVELMKKNIISRMNAE